MASQVKTIGQKLVELCNQGKNVEAIRTLYGPEAQSIEACEMPGMPLKTHGRDNILAKDKAWAEGHEIHSQLAKGPFPHGEDRFAVIFDIDATTKSGPGAGQRFQMEEVAVYTLKDNKITSEEFYYPTA